MPGSARQRNLGSARKTREVPGRPRVALGSRSFCCLAGLGVVVFLFWWAVFWRLAGLGWVFAWASAAQGRPARKDLSTRWEAPGASQRVNPSMRASWRGPSLAGVQKLQFCKRAWHFFCWAQAAVGSPVLELLPVFVFWALGRNRY